MLVGMLDFFGVGFGFSFFSVSVVVVFVDKDNETEGFSSNKSSSPNLPVWLILAILW